jgi:hypothetical protein
MKTYGGSGSIAPPILTSTLGRGEWSASRPGHFTSGKNLRYTLDKRLGGPQNRSGRCAVEKKMFLPLLGFELRPFGPLSISILTEFSWILERY